MTSHDLDISYQVMAISLGSALVAAAITVIIILVIIVTSGFAPKDGDR